MESFRKIIIIIIIILFKQHQRTIAASNKTELMQVHETIYRENVQQKHTNAAALHLHSCRCMKQSECGHRLLCTQVRFLASNHDRLNHFQVMLWPAITQDLKRIIIIDFRTFRILHQVAGD